MKANFGLLPELEPPVPDKRRRHEAYAARALAASRGDACAALESAVQGQAASCRPKVRHDGTDENCKACCQSKNTTFDLLHSRVICATIRAATRARSLRLVGCAANMAATAAMHLA